MDMNVLECQVLPDLNVKPTRMRYSDTVIAVVHSLDY